MTMLALVLLAGTQWTPQMVDGIPHLVTDDPAMTGRVEGAARVVEIDGVPAMVLDGSALVHVGDLQTVHGLPAEAFTVEAWVQLDGPQEWGGIVSALQDNGGSEQGWMLGYRQDRFAFSLATEEYGDADGAMTYLIAPEAFVPGIWHHVAGTWDGDVQRLFVDGRLVAQDATQRGAVRRPPEAPFALGAYHDANERYPMRGLLGAAALHEGALAPDEMALLSDAPERASSSPLVELALPGPLMRSFESGVVPGDDSTRVVRLPKSTQRQDRIEVDLLIRLNPDSPDGALLGARSGEDDGWSIELDGGVPLLRLAREEGEQTLLGDRAIERGAWVLLQVQADATSAALTVGGAASRARSLKGGLVGPSHRHVVLGGRRADSDEETTSLDVRALHLHEGWRSPDQLQAGADAALSTLPPPPAVDVGPIVMIGQSSWMVIWRSTGDAEHVLRWWVDDEPVATDRPDVREGWHTVRLRLPEQRLSDDGFLQYQIEERLETGERTHGPLHRVALSTDITGPGPGYVLMLQPESIQAVRETLRTDGRQITVCTDDAEMVQSLRRQARDDDLGGGRLVVHRRTPGRLPYAPWLFNQVLVDENTLGEGDLQAALTLVRPEGGLISGVTGPAAEGFRQSDQAPSTWIRGEVPGARWWARQYADPGHTSCSGDDLVKGDLHVLWWGRPGPRPMLDRGARAPSPLASHGQLYIQGDHAIFCVDAYNGSPKWAVSMPDLRRTNIPRDTSNMALGDDGRLHIAVDDDLLRFSQSGELHDVLSTPADDRAWGLVDPLPDDTLLTTLVPREAMYRGAEGEWYDAGGEESWRVAGDALLRLDYTGREIWSIRPEGWILHSTIARDDDRVFFVEVPDVELVTDGLLPQAVLGEQDLVCADLATGEEQWRRSLDVGHFDRMTYVMLAGDTVLVCGSSDKFHTLAFDARSGEPGWSKDHAWGRDHHGGPLQHPVVVGDIVYVETCAYDLETGELLRQDIPQGRGCGTKTASNHLMAFRHHFHSFWDPQSNEWTQWTGTRGGCWLGLLPAGGMLLGPETSSGCSCTHAIQTSMAWIPAHLDPAVGAAAP